MTGRLSGSRGRKRDEILARGAQLVYEQGFNATGVKEITRAAGVPKGSFYNYFDSKVEFGVACLRSYGTHWVTELETALADKDVAPLERVRNWYRRCREEVLEKGYARGCLAGNLAQELGDSHPLFHRELHRVFGEFQERIARCLSEAQAEGELGSGMAASELATFIINAWQGALLRMKASGSAEPLDNFDRMVFERLLV